jgi:hypothetical protein
MVLPEDPEEVYYGIDECGTCHAKLDNGKHLCMVDFVSPERVLMSVFRESRFVGGIELLEGDRVEFESFDNEDEVN